MQGWGGEGGDKNTTTFSSFFFSHLGLLRAPVLQLRELQEGMGVCNVDFKRKNENTHIYVYNQIIPAASSSGEAADIVLMIFFGSLMRWR
jgi:hypothetical protein